jgi:hypothetical protein
MNVTLLKALIAFLPAAMLFSGSAVLFTRSDHVSGSRPTRFLLGDFAAIAATLCDADVVTLDRVICCYPDAEALLRGAAGRARRLLAFTYPRDRWYMRVSTALQNFWRRLRGNEFRPLFTRLNRWVRCWRTLGLCVPHDTERLHGCSTSISESALCRRGLSASWQLPDQHGKGMRHQYPISFASKLTV